MARFTGSRFTSAALEATSLSSPKSRIETPRRHPWVAAFLAAFHGATLVQASNPTLSLQAAEKKLRSDHDASALARALLEWGNAGATVLSQSPGRPPLYTRQQDFPLLVLLSTLLVGATALRGSIELRASALIGRRKAGPIRNDSSDSEAGIPLELAGSTAGPTSRKSVGSAAPPEAESQDGDYQHGVAMDRRPRTDSAEDEAVATDGGPCAPAPIQASGCSSQSGIADKVSCPAQGAAGTRRTLARAAGGGNSLSGSSARDSREPITLDSGQAAAGIDHPWHDDNGRAAAGIDHRQDHPWHDDIILPELQVKAEERWHGCESGLWLAPAYLRALSTRWEVCLDSSPNELVLLAAPGLTESNSPSFNRGQDETQLAQAQRR